MTTEEAKRLVDEAFENSPVIKEWRGLAKRERIEQAKLLRKALSWDCRIWFMAGNKVFTVNDLDNAKAAADEAWQAYYDSL